MNGSWHTGKFKGGLEHGKGVLIVGDGRIKYNDQGQKILAEGTKYEGVWKQGKLDGMVTITDAKGEIRKS